MALKARRSVVSCVGDQTAGRSVERVACPLTGPGHTDSGLVSSQHDELTVAQMTKQAGCPFAGLGHTDSGLVSSHLAKLTVAELVNETIFSRGDILALG